MSQHLELILIKPDRRFAGLARREWQIYCYRPAAHARWQVRWGTQSKMIFSGTRAECLEILAGRSYDTREYVVGRRMVCGRVEVAA